MSSVLALVLAVTLVLVYVGVGVGVGVVVVRGCCVLVLRDCWYVWQARQRGRWGQGVGGWPNGSAHSDNG